MLSLCLHTALLNGSAFCLHPPGDRISDTIRTTGAWEPTLVRDVCAELAGHANPTFLDVGANIGAISVGVSQCAPHATIWAVEAADWNFALLDHNAASFPNVHPLHAALDDASNRTLTLRASNLNLGGTNARRPSRRHRHADRTARIRTTTFADLFRANPELRLPPDVLKIDIEGWEAIALAAYPFSTGVPRVLFSEWRRDMLDRAAETRGRRRGAAHLAAVLQRNGLHPSAPLTRNHDIVRFSK